VSDHGPARDLSRSAAFAELSRLLTADEPVEVVLMRTAQYLKEGVDGVADVSVTVLDDSLARTVVYTGGRAIELDETQYELESGPCLDAARTERTVLVSTRSDTRYPEFCRRARSHGVEHLMSIGLSAPGRSAAGVNVYGDAVEPFEDRARSAAGAFANYASAAINRGDHGAGVPGWTAALTSRAAVDRAALRLMTTRPCSREEAIAEMLGLARSRGRLLVETARSIIDG
jgi:hypothetical protein